MLLSLIALALCLVGWALWPRLRSVPGGGSSLSGVRVSVIIPARNEAHNLPRLLGSLAGLRDGPHEVIVVDDSSTDGTAEVARVHGARVIHPGPLPDGWRGKPWACHQGARAAEGEVFCFLDADTWMPHQDSWQRLAGAAGDGVFSVCPWHEVESPFESFSLFFNLNMVMGTTPDGLFGQVLWIPRDAYAQCGGHEAVAGRVLENHTLAAHCREAGLGVRSAAGRGLVSFRMYPGGMGTLIDGWRKGFAAGAGATPGLVMFLIVLWLSGLIMAAISLAFDPCSPWAWAAYGLAAAEVFWFSRRVGGFPLWSALFYPLPLVFFFGLFAWAKRSSGTHVTWKGREIHAD